MVNMEIFLPCKYVRRKKTKNSSPEVILTKILAIKVKIIPAKTIFITIPILLVMIGKFAYELSVSLKAVISPFLNSISILL